MKKYFVILSLLAVLLGGCRLDSFMFNPTDVDEYLLEAQGDVDRFITLDDSYDIPEDKIHLFSLTSRSLFSLTTPPPEETIYAVYLGDRARIAQDTVIVYCHGNAGNLDSYWQRVKILANLGWKNRYGVLMMDYRGYGKSTGTSTEATLHTDVEVCMKWLQDQGLTGDRTILYGFSLGSVPATKLMAFSNVFQASKLILEAPFSSFEAIVQDITKLSMSSSFYGNTQMNNAEVIKQVEEPLLWTHGEADAFMPYSNGLMVSDNYQGVKQIKVPVPGGGHSDIPAVMGIEAYSQMVYNFIVNE